MKLLKYSLTKKWGVYIVGKYGNSNYRIILND